MLLKYIVLVSWLGCILAINITDSEVQVIKHRQKRYVGFPEGSTFIATLCLTLNILERTENIFLEGINWGISYDLPNATTIQEVFKQNKFAYKRRQRRDLYNRMETVLDNLIKETFGTNVVAGWPCGRYHYCRANLLTESIITTQNKCTPTLAHYLSLSSSNRVLAVWFRRLCIDGAKKRIIELYGKPPGIKIRMGFGGKACIYRALCEANRKMNQKRITLAQEILRQFFTYPLKQLSYLEPDEHRKYHWATRYSNENQHLDCWDLFPDCTISIVNIAMGTDSGP